MRVWPIVLVLIVFISSCRPCRVVSRWADRYHCAVPVDTVTRVDTIRGDTIRIDGVFVSKVIDTLILSKDRVITRVVRSHDTISVHTQCPPSDTIRSVSVIRQTLEPVVVKEIPWWVWVVVAFFAITTAVLAISRR